jgi:hypothetical protein
MNDQTRGVSLIEVMISVGITTILGLTLFELFRQNERAFRDQDLVIEMQQNARAIMLQIADEIRMAGQGTPQFSSTFDSEAQEAATVVLNGSDAAHLHLRAGLSAVESALTPASPLNYSLGTPLTLTVQNSAGIARVLGTVPPPGRFVYIWGPCAHDTWGWLRAEVTAIAGASSRVTVIPRQAGTSGRNAGPDGTSGSSDDSIEFTATPRLSLEEAVSFHLESGSVRRATAANMSVLTAPQWGAAAELAQNIEVLRFRYYRMDGAEVASPLSELAARLSVARIDVELAAQTAQPLSNGTRQSFTLGVKIAPRNLRIH